MRAVPRSLVDKAFKVNKQLCNFSGYNTRYWAISVQRALEKEVKELEMEPKKAPSASS
jgi:hypothetical protein